MPNIRACYDFMALTDPLKIAKFPTDQRFVLGERIGRGRESMAAALVSVPANLSTGRTKERPSGSGRLSC